MEIRNRSWLQETADTENEHRIDPDSPELKLIRFAAEGRQDDAEKLFTENKLFGGKSAVDTPYGRFEGLNGIRKFCGGFLSVFHAKEARIRPMVQTRAGGRCVTELIADFAVDGMINQVSMFVVGDLKTRTTLDEARIYFHFTHVPELTGYRKPIFVSAHLEAGDPGLLTGAVREYYEALHHMPAVEPDRILATMQKGCKFGGYEPFGSQRHAVAEEEQLRATYQHMATYIPRWVSMRYETIIDDGVNCVIEWQHIVSDDGRKEGQRVAISGVSSYERGADGLLCSIRICDYAGYEKTIDWTRAGIGKDEAWSINAVHAMSGCVGCKEL